MILCNFPAFVSFHENRSGNALPFDGPAILQHYRIGIGFRGNCCFAQNRHLGRQIAECKAFKTPPAQARDDERGNFRNCPQLCRFQTPANHL